MSPEKYLAMDWVELIAHCEKLEAALWDVIDLSGRYPHPNEPEKLTNARNLLLPFQSETKVANER